MSSKRTASETKIYPKRDISRLYCSSTTYSCAKSACVSCAYKICNFDIALDADFTRHVPNVRPECCPRAKEAISQLIKDSVGTMGYHRGMSVLTVGDGDFTFSLAVARLVCDGDAGRVVATSYEDEVTLRKVYPDFESTSIGLGQYNVNVCYKVDATNLDGTLPNYISKTQKSGTPTKRKFERIVWNFPCTAIPSGQDGQNAAMEDNKELIRRFVRNSLPYLTADGEILMAHKTKPPYCQWGLETVALEGLIVARDDESFEFEYKGRLVFDKCLLKPYTPRKALDRKSFPCHDACVYVFGWKNQRSVGQYQPTILEGSNDGEKNSVIPVTLEIIDELRTLHLGFADANQEQKKHNIKRRRRK